MVEKKEENIEYCYVCNCEINKRDFPKTDRTGDIYCSKDCIRVGKVSFALWEVKDQLNDISIALKELVRYQ